jgi:hypothetical protein
MERLRNGFVTLFLQFQCKTNFRYGYSFTRFCNGEIVSDCGTDFEVKQNGKTVPFHFTFGTNNLEMIPYPPSGGNPGFCALPSVDVDVYLFLVSGYVELCSPVSLPGISSEGKPHREVGLYEYIATRLSAYACSLPGRYFSSLVSHHCTCMHKLYPQPRRLSPL